MDSFGRLPDDVLKYICYLQSKTNQPVFHFDETNCVLILTNNGAETQFPINIPDLQRYVRKYDMSVMQKNIKTLVDDGYYPYGLKLFSHQEDEYFDRHNIITVHGKKITIINIIKNVKI